MGKIMYVGEKQIEYLREQILSGTVDVAITAGTGGAYVSSVAANDIGKALEAGKHIDAVYLPEGGEIKASAVTYTKAGTTYTVKATFQAPNSGATGYDVYIFSISGTAATLTSKSVTFA